MVANFETGGKVWGPMMRGLSKGKGGFKAVLEEQTFTILGKQRPMYRVLAERKSDGASLEVVIDGILSLPVTVKSITTNKKGLKNTIVWTCKWNAGDVFEDREFVIAIKPPGP